MAIRGRGSAVPLQEDLGRGKLGSLAYLAHIGHDWLVRGLALNLRNLTRVRRFATSYRIHKLDDDNIRRCRDHAGCRSGDDERSFSKLSLLYKSANVPRTSTVPLVQ